MDDSYAPMGSLRRPLAETPPFRLGSLRVEPALLSAHHGTERIRLEPRVMRVLVALHQARGGVVSREALIADCWDGRIVSDDSIQRCIASLRKLAARADPAPFVIETIPRVGYRLTPGEPETQVDTGPARAVVDRPKGDFRARAAWVLCGIAVATALAGFPWSSLRPATPYVAVTAFEAVSQKPGDVILARALSEALASDLAGWSVPVRYAPKAGSAAGAPTYVIEGTVSAPGTRTQTLVRIVDGRSGESVWSRVFEVTPEGVDDLRPNVSAAVGAAFTGPVQLFGRDRASAQRLAAKLRIVEHMRAQRLVAALHEAERLLPTARDDPTALALFASSVAEALFDVPESERAALWRKGREAARQAVRLDPTYGEGWRAEARLIPATDFGGRLEILRAGVRRAPDSPSLQAALAEALSAVGQTRESAHWRRRVAAADPLSRDHAHGLILALADVEGPVAAYAELARARSRWAGDPFWDGVELFLAARFLDAASLDRARGRLAAEQGLTPTISSRLELLSVAMHDRSPAPAAAFGRNCIAQPSEMTTLCASALAALGRRDEAFAILDIFLADAVTGPAGEDRERDFLRAPWTSAKTSILFRSTFAELRADPRMWSLFKRLGLIDHWRASGEWPDFCSARSVPVDCPAMARAAG